MKQGKWKQVVCAATFQDQGQSGWPGHCTAPPQSSQRHKDSPDHQCSANRPGEYSSTISPHRENSRHIQANFPELYVQATSTSQNGQAAQKNFPPESSRQRYYVSFKLHIFLRTKMLNHFLKVNTKLGYYLYYLIVRERFLKLWNIIRIFSLHQTTCKPITL